METSEKEFARRAWRDSQKKRARKGFSSQFVGKETVSLDSNRQRYAENIGPNLGAGQHAAISTGADLAQLLREKEHASHADYFRSRRLLDEEAEQAVPESVVTDVDQFLTIDYAALEDSLNLLPLHEVLSIEEELLSNKPPPSQRATAEEPTTKKEPMLGNSNVAAMGGTEASPRLHSRQRSDALETHSEGILSQPHQQGPAPGLLAQPQDSLARTQHTDSAVSPSAAASWGPTLRNVPAAGEPADSVSDEQFDELLFPSSAGKGKQPVPFRKQLKGKEIGKPEAAAKAKSTSKQKQDVTGVGQPNLDDLESWLDSL